MGSVSAGPSFRILQSPSKMGPPNITRITIAQCEVCGNEYDKAFEVVMAGHTHTFDSFECAIHALAPQCTHCGCRVVGHGVEVRDQLFCCASCAAAAGMAGAVDRA
jgi:hypothetical protein